MKNNIEQPNPLYDLFAEKGTPVSIEIGLRFFLHETGFVYLLEEGNIDLFSVDITTEENQSLFFNLALDGSSFLGDLMSGEKIFLGNFQAKVLLFPFNLQSGSPLALAVVNKDLKVLKLQTSILQEKLQSDQNIQTHYFLECQNWIHSFSNIYESFENFHLDRRINEKEISLTLAQNEKFTAFENSNNSAKWPWIKVQKGELLLYNIPIAILNVESPAFPFSPLIWFKAVSSCEVQILPELQGDLCFSELLAFNRMIVLLSLLKHQNKLLLLQKHWKARKELDHELLNLVYFKIQKLFQPHSKFPILSSKNPQFLAYQMAVLSLGKNLKGEIPPSEHSLPFEEQISIWATQNEIFSREIKLEMESLEVPLLPIITRLNTPGTFPVALIPKATHYEFYSPGTRESLPFNQNLIGRLYEKGVMLYRSFPDRILDWYKVFKFSCSGRLHNYLYILLVSIISIFTASVAPFLNRAIFDDIVPSADKPLLYQIVAIIFITSFASAIFYMVRAYSILRLECLLSHDLQMALWGRLLQVNVPFFNRFTVGDLLQRVYAIDKIRQTITGNLLKILTKNLFALTYFGLMFYFIPFLSLLIFAIFTIAIAIQIGGFMISTRYNAKLIELQAQINSRMIQLISGIIQIRINGVENRIFLDWLGKMHAIKALFLKTSLIDNLTTTMIAATRWFIAFVVFYFVLSNESGKENSVLTVGTYMAFLSSLSVFMSAFTILASKIMKLTKVSPTLKRANIILQEPLDQKENKISSKKLSGHIQIAELYFRYTPEQPYVLHNLSVEIQAGEFVGIVGPSGIGKSTLLRLMLRFDNPEKGAIYYDEQNLANMDIGTVRSQIGVVLQSTSLFEGNLRDNVQAGRIASDEEIINALYIAQFLPELEQLPMGLNTPILGKGLTFSVGQKQRILIARALLKSPKILLLDEASNALDSISQDKIFKNLERLKITRLVIAHRLSTLQHADRVLTFKNGRLN